MIALFLLLTACQPKVAPVDAPPAATAKADGESCFAGTDCASGVCEGTGCDAPGVCQPAARPCTRDLVTFCACDGTTIQGSGSCPGQRVAHRGACPTP